MIIKDLVDIRQKKEFMIYLVGNTYQITLLPDEIQFTPTISPYINKKYLIVYIH